MLRAAFAPKMAIAARREIMHWNLERPFPVTLALISSTKPRLCLDLAAAPVLPRSFRPRLVQRRRGRAAHGAAVAVPAGPPARGRARRAALPARRPRARRDRGGARVAPARRAYP